jgi:hypothetical protein
VSDYSRSPLDLLVANQQKGYVGLHIEQGVPLLDRDLNLLHDLITATIRSVIARYIGNGTPTGADGFAIEALAVAAPQDFQIMAGASPPGITLVGGIEVSIPADTRYQLQAGVPALSTPSNAQPDPRTDIVYLDVFFIEVDGTDDADLNNAVDVGMQTSVRLKPSWVVRVAEGVPMPTAPAGHSYYPLAQLQRPRGRDTITAAMITDLRQSRLTVSAIEKRMALMEKLLLLPSFSTPKTIPKTGVPGQAVSVKGHNFDLGTPRVFFGGVQANLDTTVPVTATDVTVIVPNLAAGSYSLSIITDGGGPVTAPDLFDIVGNPPPPPPNAPTLNALNPINPKSGIVGAPVTIRGTNFDQPGLAVSFDMTAATVVSSSATQITVTVPNIPAGGHTITVTTNAGSIAGPSQFIVA